MMASEHASPSQVILESDDDLVLTSAKLTILPSLLAFIKTNERKDHALLNSTWS